MSHPIIRGVMIVAIVKDGNKETEQLADTFSDSVDGYGEHSVSSGVNSAAFRSGWERIFGSNQSDKKTLN